ncbi:MAG: sterol desaturase [Oleiphilus sp.]|nr:MAG: sterol desaturase [Oleiphilus sp.]
MQALLEHYYAYILMGILLLVVMAELLWSAHPEQPRSLMRMLSNVGLGVLNQWGLRTLLPGLLIISAEELATWHFGLMNWLDWPEVIEVIISILLLDCFAYWVHRLFHHYPWLWRLHLVHHTDNAIDFTTEYRHHPIEAVLLILLYLPVYLLLSPGVIAFLLHLCLQRGISLLAHADIGIPGKWNRRLNALLVTPDYHRIHHSKTQRQTDSNYSIVFSCWDALFGTQNRVEDVPERIQFGLEAFSGTKEQRFDHMLWQPFR